MRVRALASRLRSRLADPSILSRASRPSCLGKSLFASPVYLMIWPLLVCMVILYSSIFTGGPEVPEEVRFRHLDKVGHFFVFGLIATLNYRAFTSFSPGKAAFVAAVLLTSSFGVFDELVQGMNPYRSMQWSDWLVDTAGALLAVTVYLFWPFYRNLLEYRLIPRGRRENGRVCSGKTNTGVARGSRPS